MLRDDPLFENMKRLHPYLEEWEIARLVSKEKYANHYEELSKYSKAVNPIKKKIKNYSKFIEAPIGKVYKDIYELFGQENQLDVYTVFGNGISILHEIYFKGYFDSFKKFLDSYFSLQKK